MGPSLATTCYQKPYLHHWYAALPKQVQCIMAADSAAQSQCAVCLSWDAGRPGKRGENETWDSFGSRAEDMHAVRVALHSSGAMLLEVLL